MADSGFRYRAFISYSRADRRAAIRLHRALEQYSLPKLPGPARLRRLGRFFRDDEEMSASPDLGAALRGALEDSESLIVVCSPAAARSRWVNEEIVHFKRRGRTTIFAVIVDGTPNSPDPEAECFPPALRFAVDSEGRLTDQPTEPLGLDLRQEPFPRARARLAAGLLGIPFDDFWRRDRRRARRVLAVTAAGILLLLTALSALAFGWLRERETARRQEVDQALARATTDVAEGRVAQGLLRLEPYLSGAGREQVAPALRSILGWAQPTPQRLAAIEAPRLLAYRGGLLFLDGRRQVHDLSQLGVMPRRVLVTRDGRRLVVIGDFKSLVLDPQTGEHLAEMPNDEVSWTSYAFETPAGLLVVLGTRYGSTNGSTHHRALAVAADGRSMQPGEISPFIAFQKLWVLGRCEELLVAIEDRFELHPLSVRALEETVPLPPDTAFAQFTAIHPPGRPDDSPFGVEIGSWEIGSGNPFEVAGCLRPEADSGAEDVDPPLAAVAALDSPRTAPGEGWRVLREVPERFRTFTDSQLDSDGLPQVQESDRVLGRGFWRSLPTPRGMAPEDPTLDRVGGTSLAFLEDRANSGTSWRVCPLAADGRDCLEVAALHDESRSYETVRSPDGRFLLLAQAGVMIDLEAWRLVTERRELPTGSGSAFDFTPDSAQLTIASEGELLFFRPDADGTWRRSEETGIAALGEGFSGLMALADGHYVVVRRDGQVSRIDGNGRVSWRMSVAGLGDVLGLRPSADRRTFVLVGTEGLRLFESESGLPLSGVLVPPGWSSDEMSVADCVGGVDVTDDGEVRTVCMAWDDDAPRAAIWTARPFEGDLAARLRAMTCDAAPGLSAPAALEACLREAPTPEPR